MIEGLSRETRFVHIYPQKALGLSRELFTLLSLS